MSYTKITKIQKYQNFHRMDSLSEALADLCVQGHPNITGTAKKYGINCSKLSRHWNGLLQTKDLAYENYHLLMTA
jgi:hypothetical protein